MFDRITPINKALILGERRRLRPAVLLGGVLGSVRAVAAAVRRHLFQPWQLLTYGFLHGSWLHIFFNMFALFMFGSEIERLFGPRRYLIYYLRVRRRRGADASDRGRRCADLPPAPTVGASGGVFGLLLAFGMAYPQRKLIIFPIRSRCRRGCSSRSTARSSCTSA